MTYTMHQDVCEVLTAAIVLGGVRVGVNPSQAVVHDARRHRCSGLIHDR